MDDEFVGFLTVAGIILGVFFLMAIIFTIKGNSWKKKFSMRLREAEQRIDQVYTEIIGVSGKSPAQKLEELWGFAEKTVGGKLERYISDNGISSIFDTFSNLGSCGVSDTHFYYNLDQTSCDTMMNRGSLRKHYESLCGNVEHEQRYGDIALLEQRLSPYVQLKKNGCELLAKCIPLNNIVYYKIEGTVQHLSNVQGGGVNMQGAAVGAILGGGAAAIIGSQMGTETRTQFIKKDDRKITIFYKKDSNINTIEVKSTNVDNTINAFRQLIPQKEDTAVQIKLQNAQQPAPAVQSSADELKKFKDLLDCGIISQEEFDAKKKQLLGL